MKKKCYTCNKNKQLNEFYKYYRRKDGHTDYCKKCLSKQAKKWYKKNQKEIEDRRRDYKHQWYLKNREKTLLKQKEDRIKNPEKHRKRKRKYYKKNREKILAKHKIYGIEYRKTESCKQVRKRCYEKTKKKRFKYHYNRLKTDPIYKLKNKLRTRLNNYMRGKGLKKNKKHIEILGCSFEELKNHLEKLFKPGMTWENHGKWHIDHIIPLSQAKTEEELYKLSHYTNLQPLWAEENLKKNDKI